MTGWSKIEDASVWDCTVAIDSSKPIQVINYQANDPIKSLPATSSLVAMQNKKENEKVSTMPDNKTQSRLIVNADTHERAWQMWALLCSNESVDMILNQTTWLGHSTSNISGELINQQQIYETITYDDKPLEAALSSSNALSKDNAQ